MNGHVDDSAFEQAAKVDFLSAPVIQSEFGYDFGRYLTYLRATKAGRVKVITNIPGPAVETANAAARGVPQGDGEVETAVLTLWNRDGRVRAAFGSVVDLREHMKRVRHMDTALSTGSDFPDAA